MRGMIKWKPFNSLLKDSDIYELERQKMLVSKPIIMEDRVIYINYIIEEAIHNSSNVLVSYFSHGMLKRICGKIERVNVQEKYILICNSRIYFRDLINVDIL